MLLFVNANVIHHVYERGAFIGANAKGAHGEIYKFHTPVISTTTTTTTNNNNNNRSLFYTIKIHILLQQILKEPNVYKCLLQKLIRSRNAGRWKLTINH